VKSRESGAFAGSHACASAHGGSLLRSEAVLKISFDHLELSIEHHQRYSHAGKQVLSIPTRIADTQRHSKWLEAIRETRLVRPIRRKWLIRLVYSFVRKVSDSSRIYADWISRLQKKSNNMSGSEMQREKEKVAAKMREKQAAGRSSGRYFFAERI
jgi:hypothetical protein